MSILSSLLPGGVSKILEEVDKLFTSDQERGELNNELKNTENKYRSNILKDKSNARDNHAKVQVSEHASWLSKNTHELLAFCIFGATFYLYYVVLLSPEILKPERKDLVIYVLGGLTTLSATVASYLYGASLPKPDIAKKR